MRLRSAAYVICGIFAVLSATGAAAQTATKPELLQYAVMRNGEKIGTTSISVERSGADTLAKLTTRVAVKLAFVTVYRFDQNDVERWAGDKLIAMQTTTNDNGTTHNVVASRAGNKLRVDADGKVSEVDPSVVPASFWNAILVHKNVALDPNNGKLTPVSVVDHGEERLVLEGRPTLVHHYSIKTTFPQDVWYDQQHRLIKVQLHGSDGSTIQYQLGPYQLG